MRISSTSTQSIFNSLRNTVSNLHRDLADAQREVATGRVADIGIELGHSSGRRVSLLQDVERLTSISETNSISKQRLEMSLSATTSINLLSDDLMSVLTTTLGGGNTETVAVDAGQNVIASLTGILNSSYNGEALFGGINSSAPPISDFETGGGKAALEAAFLSHFGFAKSDPASELISGPDMAAFIDSAVMPLFEGAGWNTNISSASDATVTARISLTETTSASVSANEEPFRKLMFAAVIASEFFTGEFNQSAQSEASRKALELIGTSGAGIANIQGEIGFKLNRVEQATSRLENQIDELTLNADELVEVDPYEAATRLNSLVTQIETSYSLTGRIQQLSLLNFIR